MILKLRCRSVSVAAAFLFITSLKAQNQDARPSPPRETGYAVKKPVFGGACKLCPWGVEAEFIKAIVRSSGYDVQICYNCGGGPEEVRTVANAKMPPTLTNPVGPGGIRTPPPPNGPVDFGVTTPRDLWWAYEGSHVFATDGPKRNLRLIGVLQHPIYLIVAAKSDLRIIDLADIKQGGKAVRILTGVDEVYRDVLDYYGFTKDWIESRGGHLGTVRRADDRKEYDVIISTGALENVPEWSIWYEASQKYDLKFIELPDDLLAKLAKDNDMVPGTIPLGLLRGVDRPIKTVTSTGDAVYGRTDMPDDLAYAVAKAMDEHQDKLQWSNVNLSYNMHTVWRAFGVPLHPGAARYYKERGYRQ
jgi:TRAP transporter TAXI family solute receptor